MGTPEKTTFQRVSQNSSMEEQNAPFLDNVSDEEVSPPVYGKESAPAQRWPLYFNIGLFLSSIVFFATSIAVKSTGPTDIECATKMNAYCSFSCLLYVIMIQLTWGIAPVMEAVEYEWVTFENDFSTAPTKYRGKPTAELEQAWTDLWKCMFSFNIG